MDGVLHRNNLCISNRCIIWSVLGGIGKTISDHKQKCDAEKMKLIVIEWYPFDASHYLLHKNDQWNDVLLVTILRDPIERVWSDIGSGATFHCGTNISMEEYKQRLNDEAFLIECAKEYQHAFTSNVYVKIFSGTWMYAIKDREQNLKGKGIDYNPSLIVDRVHLEVAKSIIAEFDIILLLEMWQETSIQLLCNGIRETELDKFNRGWLKPQLSDFPKLKKLLYELNDFDIEFFEFAKELALQKTEQCEEHRYKQFANG